MKIVKKILVVPACVSLFIATAQSAVTITFSEVGPDVVATGSGVLNIDGLALNGNSVAGGFVSASVGAALLGSAGSFDSYSAVSGPTGFGDGGTFDASFSTGDLFGIVGGNGELYVPTFYTSGSPLLGSSTWSNHSYVTLGLTPGTYNYSWGSGATSDSLTVLIGAVPEPSSAFVLGLGALCLGARRRR